MGKTGKRHLKGQDELYTVSCGNVFKDIGCKDADVLFAKSAILIRLKTMLMYSPVSIDQGIEEATIGKILHGNLNDFTLQDLQQYLSVCLRKQNKENV